MFIQITAAGVSLLQNGPFILTEYTLGDGVNYLPDPQQTQLAGSTVWTGIPSAGTILSANVTRYSALLDRSAGDFVFGEVGFWVGNDLVAVGVQSTLTAKTKTQLGIDGNLVRLDAFLSMVGTTYDMWLNLGDTDDRLVVASVSSVDQLPRTDDTEANVFVVEAANPDQTQFFAYSNRQGLWAFDQYKYSTTATTEYTVVASTNLTLEIAGASLEQKLNPVDLGELVLQFTTGGVYSICRNIKAASADNVNDRTVLLLHTPMTAPVAAGTKFLVYNRDPFNSRFAVVDVATKSSPGIVQVGRGLDVDPQGVLDVDRSTVPGGLVYSVTGVDEDGQPLVMQGDVVLQAENIPGSVLSVNSVGPDSEGNVEVTADSISAIPLAQKGARGGVPALNGLPTDTDPYELYVKGRISPSVLPLSALSYRGTWDADTNVAAYTDGLGAVHTLSLKDGGLLDDTVNWQTTELPGDGSIFRVSVPGETVLDGYHQFGTHDLVVGTPGKWFRIPYRAMFQIALSVTGDVPDSDVLLYQVIANNLVPSSTARAVCQQPPASSVTISLKVNGVPAGTVAFAALSNTGVVNAPSLSPGDILTVETPAQTFNMAGLSLALTYTVEE